MKTAKESIFGIIGLIICAVLSGGSSQKADIRMIDGIKHVFNSEKPLRGIVALEVEKTREIDPYEQPEFGLRIFSKARDHDGSVILFEAGEAHRFAKDGRYLGLLFRKGQGPGEFADSISVSFMADEIWVSDYGKLARFDKSGKLLKETKLNGWGEYFLDDSSFFEVKRSPEGKSVEKVRFLGPGDPLNETKVFFRAKVAGMHRDPASNRGFSNIWVTTDIRYAVDMPHRVFYGMVNDSYRIEVKDLDGGFRHVIEKPFRRIKLSRKDKEKILFIRGDADKWKLNVCPDEMVVADDLYILPKGHLGVRRFVSPSDSELDVFDPEGNFVYILRHPAGVSFDRVSFHDSGFCSVLLQGDGLIYADFKVTNLPVIFQ
jgi:hypothetical protein